MTDSNDNSESIGRRDAMKAGALAAGGLAIGSVGSKKATAQTDPERLQLGPEWTLDDKDDGSLVLRNEDSGATLEYDESAGEWSVGALATGSLDADELSVGGNTANYWPPERVNDIAVDDSSPPATYTTATLSALPSDAHGAIVFLRGTGDGSAQTATLEVRTGGASRSRDLQTHLWAGHASFLGGTSGLVDVNSNNEIEYRNADGYLDNARVYVFGYY